MLMGDQVETRRDLIEQNARSVKFLDVEGRRDGWIDRPQERAARRGPASSLASSSRKCARLPDYAMSVIVSRALPDVRDGLNPCTGACSMR